MLNNPTTTITEIEQAFEAARRLAVWLSTLKAVPRRSRLWYSPSEAQLLGQAREILCNYDSILHTNPGAIRKVKDCLSRDAAIDFAGQHAASFHEALVSVLEKTRLRIDRAICEAHLDWHYDKKPDQPYRRPDTLDAAWNPQSWEAFRKVLLTVPAFSFDELMAELGIERTKAIRNVGRTLAGTKTKAGSD
jgi:hypothetical protein